MSAAQKVSFDDRGVVFVESSRAIREDREQVMRFLFENLGAPKVYIANAAVMSLYANSKTTGLVVSMGEGEAFAVPVYEAYHSRVNTLPLPVSGSLMSLYAVHQIKRTQEGTYSEVVGRRFKESLAYGSSHGVRLLSCGLTHVILLPCLSYSVA
jgi:actin-related protein